MGPVLRWETLKTRREEDGLLDSKYIAERAKVPGGWLVVSSSTSAARTAWRSCPTRSTNGTAEACRNVSGSRRGEMNRWYSWVLAPVMIAAAIIIPVAAAPISMLGQIGVYAFSTTMLLATLGLADVARFHWALRCVAAAVLLAGVAYFLSELLEVLSGKASALPARRSGGSLWGAAFFLLVFGIPALRFLMTGQERQRGGRNSRRSRYHAPADAGSLVGSAAHVSRRRAGAIDWDDDEQGWVVPARRSTAAFRILVAGRERPDERLMAHARELAANPLPLLEQVPAFLAASAREAPIAAHEIRGLRVESVGLLWPDAPDDGMVEFEGPNTEERLWRCDYADRRLRWLGFDD